MFIYETSVLLLLLLFACIMGKHLTAALAQMLAL
jgi:hypothetical protein